MKYESDILEMIHENALAEFKLGLISEAEMREYDEACLPTETPHDDFEQERYSRIYTDYAERYF